MNFKKLGLGILITMLVAGASCAPAVATGNGRVPGSKTAGPEGPASTAFHDVQSPGEGGLPDTPPSIIQGLQEDIPDWAQANTAGFGDPLTTEVSALEAFNGYLYAGIHSAAHDARIYRSPDGVSSWTPVIDPGFGISHDIAPRAILDFVVFNNQLYTSTGWGGDPGQIYRTLNGTSWSPMIIHGFSDQDNVNINALAVYDGLIYAGVTNMVSGAKIYNSYTGDSNSWSPVTPPAATMASAGVTGFAVFDGGLWATVESEDPVQIWRTYGGDWEVVVSDGFTETNTTLTGGMAEFAGHLYIGVGNTTAGAKLWRTTDGAAWEQVITPGFGDANNQKVESLYVFQDHLYASTKNSVAGIQVWRSVDGTHWEQVNQAGFGNSHNTSTHRSNATAAFRDQLYLGTANSADGGELWQMEQRIFLSLLMRDP